MYRSRYQVNQHPTWRRNTGHRDYSDRGGRRRRPHLRRLELLCLPSLRSVSCTRLLEKTERDDARSRGHRKPAPYMIDSRATMFRSIINRDGNHHSRTFRSNQSSAWKRVRFISVFCVRHFCFCDKCVRDFFHKSEENPSPSANSLQCVLVKLSEARRFQKLVNGSIESV